MYEYIQNPSDRDSDESYIQYLKHSIVIAEKTLSQPAIIWPNGKCSHEVSSAILSEIEDAKLEFIMYNPISGKWSF